MKKSSLFINSNNIFNLVRTAQRLSKLTIKNIEFLKNNVSMILKATISNQITQYGSRALIITLYQWQIQRQSKSSPASFISFLIQLEMYKILKYKNLSKKSIQYIFMPKEETCFIEKLYSAIEQQRSSVVDWDPTGKGFIVGNLTQFTNQILLRRFGIGRLDSFARKLNRHGFKRSKIDKNKIRFFHKYFNRQSKNLGKIKKLSKQQSLPKHIKLRIIREQRQQKITKTVSLSTHQGDIVNQILETVKINQQDQHKNQQYGNNSQQNSSSSSSNSQCSQPQKQKTQQFQRYKSNRPLARVGRPSLPKPKPIPSYYCYSTLNSHCLQKQKKVKIQQKSTPLKMTKILLTPRIQKDDSIVHQQQQHQHQNYQQQTPIHQDHIIHGCGGITYSIQKEQFVKFNEDSVERIAIFQKDIGTFLGDDFGIEENQNNNDNNDQNQDHFRE